MIMDFPDTFNNQLQVIAKPTVIPSNGLPRVKLCSAVIMSTGENLPCPKCMNMASLRTYAETNAGNSTINDAFEWTIPAIMNFGFRNTSESPNANKMTYLPLVL